MTTPADSAREDLAFLRGLVQSGGGFQRRLGEGYVAAGLCYGVQMLLHLGQGLGWVPSDAPWGLTIGLGPTVVFIGLAIWLSIRNRGPVPGASVVARAVGSVFMALGLSNIALIAIIGSQAVRLKSLEIWLIYPCVVLTLQGAGWLIVYTLRRQAWIAAVAVGWFVTGVAMAFSIGHPMAFIIVGAAGFWGLMVAPGVYMMRQPKDA
ncbi:MAG TPA: hypothetical protein VF495_13925 [Phenylobacterium sp.]